MYKEILKQANYKLTKPRQLVLNFLEKRHDPISAGDIYNKLKKELDRVTVYRILEVFEELGIVFKENRGKEALYYLADKQHHHIVCQKCGLTECVPCNHFFNKIKNFNNIKHQLILTGLCNNCNN